MKVRLDLLLVERQLAPSRTAAAAMIMAGEVSTDQGALTKAGQLVPDDIQVSIKQRSRYVSRGGDKLASVADELKLDFTGLVVLDVGSSTGGFTDYALQHGAKKVYSVDVGHGQLDYKLRQDPRVIPLEHSDIRTLESLPELVDVAVADISFISLTKALSSITPKLMPGRPIIAMCKPQFEAGRVLATKYKGVIREPVRGQVIAEFEGQISGDFEIIAAADSKVPGPSGNIERFYKLVAKH